MSDTLTDTSGATPEPQFEAAIWADDPWPVDVEMLVEHPADWGFNGLNPTFKCRRKSDGQHIWVRGTDLYILPNAPERSAS